jgi:hypothetical protein
VATQDPKVKTGFHIPEYRLQQDATVKQALGKVNLTSIHARRTVCS